MLIVRWSTQTIASLNLRSIVSPLFTMQTHRKFFHNKQFFFRAIRTSLARQHSSDDCAATTTKNYVLNTRQSEWNFALGTFKLHYYLTLCTIFFFYFFRFIRRSHIAQRTNKSLDLINNRVEIFVWFRFGFKSKEN